MRRTGTVFYTKDCLGCELISKNRGEQLMAPLPSYTLKSRGNVFA